MIYDAHTRRSVELIRRCADWDSGERNADGADDIELQMTTSPAGAVVTLTIIEREKNNIKINP